MDASQCRTVLASTSETAIQTLGRNDPQIKAMVDAIGSVTDVTQW